MHIIQEEIGIPKITQKTMGDNHAIFTVEPLPPGYGMTLGNTFRRVLLSSIPGVAVSGVKIAGVTHEYTTIKGVKDSILDITLNLKRLFIKKTTKEPTIVHLKTSKEGIVTAKDIQVTSDIEILNPDHYITEITDKNTKLEMDIIIEKGVGYLPSREQKNADPHVILIDAIFSPVIKVRYDTENTRVGQMTNLDKLTIEILTNGAITPEDAIKFSSNVIQSYFKMFNETGVEVETDFMSDISKIIQKEKEEQASKPNQDSYTPIEILGLSPRTLNALINGGIGSIEQLTKCTISKLNNLRGFGKKAANEVRAALAPRNLTLSDD
ncbi:DNA-directed RNA polymerase subunit alpha [Patescibacteria group bacterium]|nr:DNA-directed RNA polymerase subunit alpha [Patescibacteria group bacterium]